MIPSVAPEVCAFGPDLEAPWEMLHFARTGNPTDCFSDSKSRQGRVGEDSRRTINAPSVNQTMPAGIVEPLCRPVSQTRCHALNSGCWGSLRSCWLADFMRGQTRCQARSS